MNFYVFEQIPKFAPEKYWAEGGVYSSAPGAVLMASYCDLPYCLVWLPCQDHLYRGR